MTYVSFFGNTEILGIQKQAVKVFHHVKHCVKGNFIGHLTPNNTMLRYSHTISMCVLLINKSSIHSDHSNLIFKRACCSYRGLMLFIESATEWTFCVSNTRQMSRFLPPFPVFIQYTISVFESWNNIYLYWMKLNMLYQSVLIAMHTNLLIRSIVLIGHYNCMLFRYMYNKQSNSLHTRTYFPRQHAINAHSS